MQELSSISGFWTGYLVHDRTASQVNISLTFEDQVLNGSYDLPASVEKSRRHADFTATPYGHWIHVKLSEYDPHGALEFHVTVLEEGGVRMMYGVIPMPSAKIPFATITLYQTESPIRRLSGAWPF
jgi:hypothetical protein